MRRRIMVHALRGPAADRPSTAHRQGVRPSAGGVYAAYFASTMNGVGGRRTIPASGAVRPPANSSGSYTPIETTIWMHYVGLVCLRSEESSQETHEPSKPTAASFSAPPFPGRNRLTLGAPESRSEVLSCAFEAFVPIAEPSGQVLIVGPGVAVADQLLIHHDPLHGHEADNASVMVPVKKPELRSSSPYEPRQRFAGLASPWLVVLGRVHVSETDREPTESTHVCLDTVTVHNAPNPARQKFPGELSPSCPRCSSSRDFPVGVSSSA